MTMSFATIEARRAYEREYRRLNPEKMKAKQRAANARHKALDPERHRERDRVSQVRYRRARTPEKIAKDAEKKREYQRNNRDICRSTRNNYRARKMKADGLFTAEEFSLMCRLYGGLCLSCKQVRVLTADHVVPLSKGGTNDIYNIQPLCKQCNSYKARQAR